MTTTQRAALLAFFVGATASGMSTAALLREAPGAKAYFTHHLSVDQVENPDGGLSDVSAVASVLSTLTLADGGTEVVQLPPTFCPLTDARKATLRTLLTAVEGCGKNAE